MLSFLLVGRIKTVKFDLQQWKKYRGGVLREKMRCNPLIRFVGLFRFIPTVHTRMYVYEYVHIL